MKKIIFCLFLLFSMNRFLLAQIIYTDEASEQKYLFIGGIYNNQLKLLNLKDYSVIWLDKGSLQQTDQLAPATFLEKLFASKLYFHADGSEPHWQALISQKTLQLDLPNGKQQTLNIQIDLDNQPMDSAFVLMFQSKDRQTYGLIRALPIDSPCDINNDGTNIFEIFINTQGQIIRGCASIDTKKATALYPLSLE